MQNQIADRDRLIFALDVATAAEARAWVDRLGDSVNFYKLGMELLTSGEYFVVLDELARRDKKIFVDLKFHDVPATVAAAVKGLSRWPVQLCTVHSYETMLRAANEVKGGLKLLTVTVLTSMDRADLQAQGVSGEPAEVVIARARQAQSAGGDGVICSGLEAAAIRTATGEDFLIVCPGIRPAGPGGDDQKRTVDVRQAFANGADYIVVGRPIRHAGDPRAEAERMQTQIADSADAGLK
jgi:orotidine-5'-phosphate decarboxylase